MSRLPLEGHDSATAAGLIEEGVIPEVPKRKAQLVMGEPLGLAAPRLDGNGLPLESDSNSPNEDIPNEEILVDLPDNSTDLELTHLRLKTLRGLSLHRFKNVQVSPSLQSHPKRLPLILNDTFDLTLTIDVNSGYHYARTYFHHSLIHLPSHLR